MKRKTLDAIFTAGGIGFAALMLVLGVVMTSNANFAHTYVKSQLTEPHISLPPPSHPTAEEDNAPCLVASPVQHLTTAKRP